MSMQQRERVRPQLIYGCVTIQLLGGKFFHQTHEHGPFNNTLEASAYKALTPRTRFYLELSKQHAEEVHIRSCYNNKYWVPKEVNGSWYIFVEAEKPEEDKVMPHCTLFRFIKFWDFPDPLGVFRDIIDWSETHDDPSILRILPSCFKFEGVKFLNTIGGHYGPWTRGGYYPGCIGRTKEGRLYVTSNDQALPFRVTKTDKREREIMLYQPIIGWVAIKVGDNYDDKFVRHTREDGEFNNALKTSGDKALTPYTRFYLEPSAKDKRLVHIRSCYNNKYWVPKMVNDTWYIFIEAKEPIEDKTNSSCTLFELPQFDDWETCSVDPSAFRIIPCASIFEHVEDPTVERMFAEDGFKAKFEDYPPGCLGRTTEGCLFVTSFNQGLKFRVITLHDEKALPAYVRFKGENGKYLGSDTIDVLKFAWEDGNNSSVIHSIETSPDGTFIHIKSEKSGKLWRCNPNDNNWIAPNADKDDEFTRFEVVRLSGNVIALKNKGNGKFAKRWTDGDKVDGLSANIDSTEISAQLKLEEAVVARKIYNVQYHMDAARVYDHKELVMATASSVNSSSTETTAKLTLKYSVDNTSAWSKTTTEMWDVNTTFHAGVPSISIGFKEFSIGIQNDIYYNEDKSSEQTYTKEHGGTQSRSEEQSVDYEMKVPPRTKMTLRATTSQVSYDIPYSYIQKDVLADGRRLLTMGEDGLFQGVSCHEFTYEVSEEKLDTKGITENSNNNVPKEELLIGDTKGTTENSNNNVPKEEPQN